MKQPYHILIVDDHKILLDSLSLLIDSIDQMSVIGTLSDSRTVLDFLSKYEVDVLITDMRMPYMSGTELTIKVKESYPNIKILMLTVNDTPETVREAFQAGVSGYITKKANKDELEDALKTILSGKNFFSNEVIKELLYLKDITNKEAYLEEFKALSARELEIVKLIGQELSSVQIAEKLFISPGTVENHRHNILQKLGVKNSIGIIKYAIKNNLI